MIFQIFKINYEKKALEEIKNINKINNKLNETKPYTSIIDGKIIINEERRNIDKNFEYIIV